MKSVYSEFSRLLVIVESPAKCKTIANHLNSLSVKSDVIASYGHIRRLPRKNGSVLPNEGFRMIWEENPNSTKYIQNILNHAKEIEAKKGLIVLATDADREGEAIGWHLAEIITKNGINAPIKRMIFHEITKKGIINGLKNLMDIQKSKVESYFARLSIDYLVGFNLSPILWTKVKGCKSAGRVQSAALRAIVERELEIIEFKSQPYWTLEASFEIKDNIYQASLYEWNDSSLEKFMWTHNSVHEARDKLKQDSYKIIDIERSTQSRSPYPPFTTSTMQQDASRRLGWRPMKTSKIAQKLYEGVKIGNSNIGLITYMRTDSTRMSDDAINNCLDTINTLFGKPYSNRRTYEGKSENIQDAHEAIRPTDFTLTPENMAQHLDEDMLKLYTLIWNRATASQMSDAKYNTTNIFLLGNYGKWKIHGREMEFEGFLRLYPDDISDSQIIAGDVTSDTPSKCLNVDVIEHATQPKGRFTESGLIKHLDEVGIGRPSTYATVLETLEEREYITRQGKKLVPQIKGWVVTGFLQISCPDYIKDEFTALVEEELDKIAQEKVEWKFVLDDFWRNFTIILQSMSNEDSKKVVSKIANLYKSYFFGVEEDSDHCPKCKDGSKILCLLNDGQFLGCSNHPDCDWKQSLEQKEPITLGHDPESNNPILIKHGPYGHYLVTPGKNVPIPDKLVDKMTLQMAKALSSLPKVLGKHPVTGKDIKLGIGRYGPYILYNSIYVSCPLVHLENMTLDKALTIIGASKKF